MKYTVTLSTLFATLLAVAAPAFASSEHGGVSASGVNDHTAGWNVLWHEVLLDIYSIAVVFLLIAVWLMVSFTRKSEDQEGAMPAMSLGTSMAWALVPSFLFLADDLYLAANGWKLWIDQRTVPEGAVEITVEATRWNWAFEYENGITSDNVVYIPVGAPVVFRTHSEIDDVIHGFFVPDRRIKEDVMPGHVTFTWFIVHKPKTTLLTCTEYCGAGHSDMFGSIVAVPQAEYDAIIAGGQDAFDAQLAKDGLDETRYKPGPEPALGV